MTSLRLVDGSTIELDGRPIARLLPAVSLTLRDKLTAAFDALDEDENCIAELEGRIKELDAQFVRAGR